MFLKNNPKTAGEKDKFEKLCDYQKEGKKTLEMLGIVFKFYLLHNCSNGAARTFRAEIGIQFARFSPNYTAVPDIGRLDK